MQKGAILRKCVNTFVPHCRYHGPQYLWCKFQSRLLFIISLLLKNFLTALYIQINKILSYLKYLLLAAILDIVLCLHIHGLV